MGLHPQSRRLLDLIGARGDPDRSQLTPAGARELAKRNRDLRGEAVPMAEVRPVEIPTNGHRIPARLYRPTQARAPGALVWLHGGGWVVGDLDGADVDARLLARESGLVVISVGYRLAPEHPFPAGLEDAYLATGWVAANRERLGVAGAFLAIGGDSAGGNLAASVSLLARARGGPAIYFQLLIYPVMDWRLDTPAWRELGHGYWLTREAMAWNWDHYLPAAERRGDPLASPLRATTLSGLPPALLVTAEFDPLHAEGEAYAAKLEADGVPVRLKRYSGMIHGFFSCGAVVEQAFTAGRLCGETLRRHCG